MLSEVSSFNRRSITLKSYLYDSCFIFCFNLSSNTTYYFVCFYFSFLNLPSFPTTVFLYDCYCSFSLCFWNWRFYWKIYFRVSALNIWSSSDWENIGFYFFMVEIISGFSAFSVFCSRVSICWGEWWFS